MNTKFLKIPYLPGPSENNIEKVQGITTENDHLNSKTNDSGERRMMIVKIIVIIFFIIIIKNNEG